MSDRPVLFVLDDNGARELLAGDTGSGGAQRLRKNFLQAVLRSQTARRVTLATVTEFASPLKSLPWLAGADIFFLSRIIPCVSKRRKWRVSMYRHEYCRGCARVSQAIRRAMGDHVDDA